LKIHSDCGECQQAQAEWFIRRCGNKDTEVGCVDGCSRWCSAPSSQQPCQTVKELVKAFHCLFIHDIARAQDEGWEVVYCITVQL